MTQVAAQALGVTVCWGWALPAQGLLPNSFGGLPPLGSRGVPNGAEGVRGRILSRRRRQSGRLVREIRCAKNGYRRIWVLDLAARGDCLAPHSARYGYR